VPSVSGSGTCVFDPSDNKRDRAVISEWRRSRLMQYFGYLRRNSNDPPDNDYPGFEFWLTKLNQFNGDFANAEVKAFITSIEYQQRFGP
jgi:hypothetical protein